jgi:hypothetical protein
MVALHGEMPAVIRRWHEIVDARDTEGLREILADDVVFQSPVVHTPQQGKALTFAYLHAALHVLNNDTFHYLNEWYGPRSAVLEFAGRLDDTDFNGVDMIFWNDAGKITTFRVMVRPLKAVNKVHGMMGQMLEAMKKAKAG